MRCGRNPALLLPFPAAAALFLGVAAVIAGILGMHMFSASHHEPAAAVAAVAAHPEEVPAQHGPDAAPGAGGHGCSAPCSQDHGSAGSVCTLMIFVLILLLRPKVLSVRRQHSFARGVGGPDPRAVPQTPSLIELCISRT
ncbi:DUF6153 family protein [Arthrobacter sp. NPDC097144]|uniref:DUF6153 family protein n=1 Tax=Arthrobacter sp. NPDC097144 TaxID=3363946 RepID=UPI00382CED42